MTAERDRLLIASPRGAFLATQVAQLRKTYEIQIATTSDMAIYLNTQWEPSVCIVDFDSDIQALCLPLRSNYPQSKLGLIAVSSKNDLGKEEKAFTSGCDHFITLNSDDRQLFWRLRSLLRRLKNTASDSTAPLIQCLPQIEVPIETATITIGSLNTSSDLSIVKRSGHVIGLSPTQHRLLIAFLSHPDQLLTRTWIKEKVWAKSEISERTIDAQISKLKKVIPELDLHLINVYGKGYVFTKEKRAA